MALAVVAGALLAGAARGEAREWFVRSPMQDDYVPSHLTVRVGDTVTWINDGAVLHEVRFEGNPLGTGEANLQRFVKRGRRLSLTFEIPGVYPYRCQWHGMHSVIEVLPEE